MISQIVYEALNVTEAARSDKKTMRNVYKCPKGHYTFTVDRDYGVTPFLIACEHRTYLASQTKKGASFQCRERAQSSAYQFSDAYLKSRYGEPVLEFYRPTYEYYLTIKNESLKEHLEAGGLALRKIGED